MAERSRITNSGTTEDGKHKFVVKQELPEIAKRNSLFQRLLQNFRSFPLVGGMKNDEILSDMNDRIADYTHKYINKIKQTTGDDITRFLNVTLQQGGGAGKAMSLGIRSTDDLFNNDTANFGAFFFERYKNINNKYEDLRILIYVFMSKCLYEFMQSDKKSMRLAFFELRKKHKKTKSGGTKLKCKSLMPRSSLEDGDLLPEILTLFDDIRTGRRDDIESIEEYLKLRTKIFA